MCLLQATLLPILYLFIYLFSSSTSSGIEVQAKKYWPNGQRRVNKPFMCGHANKQKETNYNFPSKVYEKSKVRSVDLNTDKLFS